MKKPSSKLPPLEIKVAPSPRDWNGRILSFAEKTVWKRERKTTTIVRMKVNFSISFSRSFFLIFIVWKCKNSFVVLGTEVVTAGYFD